MIDGGNQPGIKVIKAARIFNPLRVLLLTDGYTKKDLDAVLPGFMEVTSVEYDLYLATVSKALAESQVRDIDTYTGAFWAANAQTLPMMYSFYRIYSRISSSSADTERSFSRLKMILRKNRESMTESTLRSLLFLN